MSSPVVDTSPKAEWRKPSQILKLHRKKKKTAVGKSLNLLSNGVDHGLQDSGHQLKQAGKRRNPFGCTQELKAAKKHHVDGDEPDEASVQDVCEKSANTVLFNVLDQAEEMLSVVVKDQQSDFGISQTVVSTAVLQEEQKVPTPPESGKTSGIKWESGENVPCDWSLKQKVRFLSEKDFSECTNLKSVDEAVGLNSFVTMPHSQGTVGDQSPGSAFHSCTMYWQHPNLPWIKLFPRYMADNNRVSRASLTTTDEEVLSALRSDWSESFTSVFYSLRAKLCPYFYLCGHQFTAIFLASGIQGETIQAIVTPTTRGFREALTNEGIDFTLPLLDQAKKQADVETAMEEEEDLDKADHTAASVWLESIGLNKSQFPSLDPTKVKIQRECFKSIDNRPQSSVLVEGGNVQALFNFLLNWRSCIASSGPQTGLPPTILSPVTFKGSTLQSLKVKRSVVRHPVSDGSMRNHGVLELTGPILPHNILSLVEFFRNTHSDGFTASLNNHDPTSPLNSVSKYEEDTKLATISLLQRPRLSTGALKELEYSNNQFYWVT